MKMKEMLKNAIIDALNSHKLDEIEVRFFELCILPYDDIPAVMKTQAYKNTVLYCADKMNDVKLHGKERE